MMLRNSENQCSLVSIYIKHSDFSGISRQTKIESPTDITTKISDVDCKLFMQVWYGMPVRHIGVSVSKLSSPAITQLTFFHESKYNKKKSLDLTIYVLETRCNKKGLLLTF